MSKFNSKQENKPDTVTYEGSKAFSKTVVNDWFNFLFSCFLENSFYESSKIQLDRFLKLTDEIAEKYGYRFVAKAAIFARNELGMRSISQLTAAWLNNKSFQNKKEFYKTFMHRPDDVAEIFGAVDYLGGKRSHALIKGSAAYLETLDEYSIMKYRMQNKTYNMYDIVNLCHPKGKIIDDFVNHKLDSADTWENKISTASNEEERSKEWKRLVEEGKLGYMALIRNLNNILRSDISVSWIEEILCPQLENEYAIKKSLIFPYRIYTAYKNLNINNTNIILSLEKAFRCAIKNVPKFEGYNGIILDVSGSMTDAVSAKSNVSLKEVGACFAMTLMLTGAKVDFIKFGSTAKRIDINILDNIFKNIDKIAANDNCGYGTEIHSALRLMHRSYDRIFLISDMQILEEGNIFNFYHYNSQNDAYKEWLRRYNKINTYSFDLGHYSSQLLPQNKIIYLTSLSDNIFKFVKFMDSEINIIDVINNSIDF